MGFPLGRTKVLFDQGLPHAAELHWELLGPLDLGLGSFVEVACLHRASGCLLVTDALVGIGPTPPSLFDGDPRPLLFHARERGDEPLLDTPERRQLGWQRLVLFASYLRPASLQVPGWLEVWADAFAPGLRMPAAYFGLYPFRWQPNWLEEFRALVPDGGIRIQVAPILERLVFPRSRAALLEWIRRLAASQEVRWLVPAHYEAPVGCSPELLKALADGLEQRPWAPNGGSWAYLASIDESLVRLKLVPGSSAGNDGSLNP